MKGVILLLDFCCVRETEVLSQRNVSILLVRLVVFLMEVGKANGNLPLYTMESCGIGVLNGVTSVYVSVPFGGKSRLVFGDDLETF